jgi:chemotaxis signal transduction protein
MRYFLCGFDQFVLGIPEDAVAAIMIYPETVTAVIRREEGGNVFFSLPHFFEMADKTVRHGIILKAGGGPEPEGEEGPRQVLLVRSVEREADIAPEDICRPPDLLTAWRKIPFLQGISFTGETMITFVDPAALIARILEAEGEGQ